MQSFKMIALGSLAKVEVAYAAQFEWADGTVEFLLESSLNNDDWKTWGITQDDRDRILAAIAEHKKANEGNLLL